jgi:signal transduction histidine kinase
LVSDLQPYLDSKPTVRVRYHLSPALPQLRTDPAKLKIVMKNVIENAVKFTESGEVHVTASPHANGIEVMIRDPGIGIEPAVMPIVFEPFRQGETAMTRRFGGVGLGLYIVRRLLEVLGGRITLESSPGSGTTARVWVPREIQST